MAMPVSLRVAKHIEPTYHLVSNTSFTPILLVHTFHFTSLILLNVFGWRRSFALLISKVQEKRWLCMLSNASPREEPKSVVTRNTNDSYLTSLLNIAFETMTSSLRERVFFSSW